MCKILLFITHNEDNSKNNVKDFCAYRISYISKTEFNTNLDNIRENYVIRYTLRLHYYYYLCSQNIICLSID